MTVDYIIIGQGIAGTSIAQQLHKAGYSFVIIDQFAHDQSSRIASGLWNPIVLKRMKKVWQSDDMLQQLPHFYRDAETLYTNTFQEDIRVNRLFTSQEETNTWTETADQPAFEALLTPLPKHSGNAFVKDIYGLGEVVLSGRVNTTKWLNSARDWFAKHQFLVNDKFVHSDLSIDPHSVRYRDISATGVIFCEGMHTAMNNPFFSWLPFALTKGEVLHIKSPQLKLDRIINGSVFIMPLGQNEYKVGATYAWNTTDTTPTKKSKNELIEKLNKIIDVPFEIITHKAGIRPTVADRRPLLGTHPAHKNMHIFNGLGSRGVLMAPYLSNMMADYLLNKKNIHPEANISRFLKKHYPG